MKLFFASLVISCSFCIISSCNKIIVNQLPSVEAGTNVTIKLPLDSALLDGTASAADYKLFSFFWTKLSGEGSPEILHPELLSTWVKNLKDGIYVFELRVTDGQGNTAIDTITITVLPQDVHTMVFNPDSNSNEVHLFGNDTSIDQTDFNAPELDGASGTYYGVPVDIRGLVQFDLSQLPAHAVIKNAKLTLYSNHTPLNGQTRDVANSGTDNSLYLQRVTEPWVAHTVNWVTQPAATSINQVSIPHTVEHFLDVELNVTDLVTDMISTNNYGFLLRLQNEVAYNFRIFCSSKYADATRHPKLEVSYTE